MTRGGRTEFDFDAPALEHEVESRVVETKVVSGLGVRHQVRERPFGVMPCTDIRGFAFEYGPGIESDTAELDGAPDGDRVHAQNGAGPVHTAALSVGVDTAAGQVRTGVHPATLRALQVSASAAARVVRMGASGTVRDR